MSLDAEARAALKAAQEADGAHRADNPAQRAPGVSVDLGASLDPLNPGSEWATLIRPWGRFVAVFLPEVADAYSGPAWDKACSDFGAAFHAVAEKRQWRIDNVAPEFALAMCCLNIAAPAAVAVYGRKAVAKAKASREGGREGQGGREGVNGGVQRGETPPPAAPSPA
jgi:hypothetical protein